MHIQMQGYPCIQNRLEHCKPIKSKEEDRLYHATGDDRKGSLHPLETFKTICLHLDSVSSKVAVNMGRGLEKTPTIIIYLKCLLL